jgi:hypothetical protein
LPPALVSDDKTTKITRQAAAGQRRKETRRSADQPRQRARRSRCRPRTRVGSPLCWGGRAGDWLAPKLGPNSFGLGAPRRQQPAARRERSCSVRTRRHSGGRLQWGRAQRPPTTLREERWAEFPTGSDGTDLKRPLWTAATVTILLAPRTCRLRTGTYTAPTGPVLPGSRQTRERRLSLDLQLVLNWLLFGSSQAPRRLTEFAAPQTAVIETGKQ